MHIHPERLCVLRKRKGLSRAQLAKRAKISDRQIQRIENKAPSGKRGARQHTVNGLAEALGVDIGVLTGELPLPAPGKEPARDPERVQIGALIPPKVRLAYDLVKIRYGVNMTEVVTMAPLFFVLLAEGSLARRGEKQKEVNEIVRRLEKIQEEIGHEALGLSTTLAMNERVAEEESIEKADIFGRDFAENKGLADYFVTMEDKNPFATYLHKLGEEIDKAGIVDVEGSALGYGSSPRFPDYDLWREELDRVTGGSRDARRALELGFVRLSEISEELMKEDSEKKRIEWIEEKLPDRYRNLDEVSREAGVARKVSNLSDDQLITMREDVADKGSGRGGDE